MQSKQKPYPVCNFKEYRPSRNPYYKSLQELAKTSSRPLAILDHACEEWRGKWRTYLNLPESASLTLELGAYHGETLISQAKAYPERGHIGVEWKYKQCFKAAKKSGDEKLNNICFLRANISRLSWMFNPGEIDRVIILFPDPWSKSAHQKWRLLNPGFFRILGCHLKTGARVFIKTDHAEYFEYIGQSIREAACFDFNPNEEEVGEFWQKIPPTPFQKIFLRQGRNDFYSYALIRNTQLVVPPEPVQNVLGLSV